MHALAFAINYQSGLPLIVGAGFIMYIASKAVVDVLTAGNTTQPGRLALGHWMPIAVLAIVAAATNRQDIAVGLIFSSSVACLSLAVGSVAFLGTIPLLTSLRQTWAMLVPAGLLAFLVGLHGNISVFNSGVFAIQGLCVLMLWDGGNIKTGPLVALPAHAEDQVQAIRLSQLLLAVLITVVGAFMALYGIDLVSAQSEFATPGLLTATLLAPLMVLPIIGTGTEQAQRNESESAITAQIGVALLNLCALVPLVALSANIANFARHHTVESITASIRFPMATWRVDVLLILILSLILLPVALGRWTLSRMQGLTMMMGYAAYLAMALAWQEYSLHGVAPKAHP